MNLLILVKAARQNLQKPFLSVEAEFFSEIIQDRFA